MTVQPRSSNGCGSVGFSCPSRAGRPTGTKLVYSDQSRARRNAIQGALRSVRIPSQERYLAAVATLTVAALVVGALKGGWLIAAILSVVALVESLALIACARKATNA